MGRDRAEEQQQLVVAASREGEAEEKLSKLQQVKNYFYDQGLTVRDLPTAFVYHEVLGLAMAAGFWSVSTPAHCLAHLPVTVRPQASHLPPAHSCSPHPNRAATSSSHPGPSSA